MKQEKGSLQQKEQQFVKAYDEYADAIFRFCLTKIKNRDVAKDITQDTFIKTWDYIVSGKTITELRPFLYRVARNLIIDFVRKKKSVSLDMLTESGIESFDIHEQTPEHHIFDIAQAITLLDSLDPKYRDILYMRFIDDLSITEIADALGENPNTVSVKIHRALEHARTHLKEFTTRYGNII